MRFLRDYLPVFKFFQKGFKEGSRRLWLNFHQIKSVQAKKDIQMSCHTKILKNLNKRFKIWIPFKNSRIKIKILQQIVQNEQIKTCAMVQLPGRSELAWSSL